MIQEFIKKLQKKRYSRYIQKHGLPNYIFHSNKDSYCTCIWDAEKLTISTDFVLPILNKYDISTSEDDQAIITMYVSKEFSNYC